MTHPNHPGFLRQLHTHCSGKTVEFLHNAANTRKAVSFSDTDSVGTVIVYHDKEFMVLQVRGAKKCVLQVMDGYQVVNLKCFNEFTQTVVKNEVVILDLNEFLKAFDGKDTAFGVFTALKHLELQFQERLQGENKRLQEEIKRLQEDKASLETQVQRLEDEASANAITHAAEVLKLEADLTKTHDAEILKLQTKLAKSVHDLKSNIAQVATAQQQVSQLRADLQRSDDVVRNNNMQKKLDDAKIQKQEDDIKGLKAQVKRLLAKHAASGGAAGAAAGAAPEQYHWGTTDQFNESLKKIQEQAEAAAEAAEAELKMLVESAKPQCDAEIREYRDLLKKGSTGVAQRNRLIILRKYHPDKHTNKGQTLIDFFTRMYQYVDGELKPSAPV